MGNSRDLKEREDCSDYHDDDGRDRHTLMERMATSLGASIRWFIDQHSVHSHDVRSSETFHITEHLS